MPLEVKKKKGKRNLIRKATYEDIQKKKKEMQVKDARTSRCNA